ncbi:MarR family winged helix-turn-helix transcriptional regulator [Angustibacter sp. McL0619]|uniref:MarR family winged helix-turn-helix transcriptional regulator n=1 Tax=Angustibacter sp. McL0619 TaxID=3415676 RepID=UPI003CF77DFD
MTTSGNADRGTRANLPDERELAFQLVTSSARLVRFAARQSSSPVPRALARALSVINELGEPRISDIAAADRISQPTATTLVQKLEERGWVARTTDPRDARAVRIHITQAGRDAITEFRKSAADALVPALGALDEADLAALTRGVQALNTMLEHQNPQEDTA